MRECQLCGSERDDCHKIKADGIGRSSFNRGDIYYLCPFCYTSSPSGMAEGYCAPTSQDLWKAVGRVANYLEKMRFLPHETQQGKEIEVLRLENENLRIKLKKLS